MKFRMIALGMICAASLGLLVTPSLADDTTAKLIEAARSKAAKIDELKKILNDPDPTLRFAAFDAMLASEDPLMRDLAIQTGMDSTDSVMRGMALRRIITGRERIEFRLSPDPTTPEAVQKAAREMIEKGGSVSYSLGLKRDQAIPSDGTIVPEGCGSRDGKVTGLLVTFRCNSWDGEVELQADNSLLGAVYFRAGNTIVAFKATAKAL